MIRQMATVHSKDIPKKCGVYIIHARRRDECYIGSSIDLNKRFRNHLRKLIKGNHPNPKLQKCFNKRQILFFSVSVFCSPIELTRHEQQLLNAHKFNGKLLNRTQTAAHHAGRGWK